MRAVVAPRLLQAARELRLPWDGHRYPRWLDRRVGIAWALWDWIGVGGASPQDVALEDDVGLLFAPATDGECTLTSHLADIAESLAHDGEPAEWPALKLLPGNRRRPARRSTPA